MPAVSKKQQRFFGMVRAAQKGEGAASPEVAKVASEIKKKDAKDFASTKHKGLPMKKEEVQLKEYSPNLAHSDKSKGRLSKSSVYSLRGKDESKKEFRKSYVKDVEDGYVGKGHKPTPGKFKKEELTFEGWKEKAGDAIKKALKKKDAPKHDYGRDAGAEAAKRLRKKDHEKVNFLDPDD